MKKTLSIGLVICASLLLCSCKNEEHMYSTYNPSVYYGMPQSEVDKILSENHLTVKLGDTITYDIPISQDFLDIDSEYAVAPEVTYKFVDGKLDEITHTYNFPEGTPSDVADLYNTHLASAIQLEKSELEQQSTEVAENVVWNYFSTTDYWKGDEMIFFLSSNSIDGSIKYIEITFTKSQFSH